MSRDERTLWRGVTCHQTVEDLFNYDYVLRSVDPRTVIEVGPGEGGTLGFLRDVAGCEVLSVGEGDSVPEVGAGPVLVILDGDVYSREAIARDLVTYAPLAQLLVVCHTARPDWGSKPASEHWARQFPEWTEFGARFPTRHSWFKKRL